MKAYVIYDSRFGNTRKIAEGIAGVLEVEYTVMVCPAEEALPLPPDIALLVVGGPTHAHGMSAPMKALFAQFERGMLKGVPAAAFDTRLQMPRWLSGSAAHTIAERLEKAGCRMVLPAESFYVSRESVCTLLPGEEMRAKAWAAMLLANAGAPAVAGTR